MAVYKLFCLGNLELELDGRPVKLEMRKSLALLLYLRMAGHDCPREHLSALFWPEFDQHHAQANLRRTLASLIKSLQIDLIEADREKIGLRDPSQLWLDVEVFQAYLASRNTHPHPQNETCPKCLTALENAVQVYQGDFLVGFNLKDCPEFDEWQLLQRENLRDKYADTLEKLATYHQGQCEWERAVFYARSWLSLDQLNETAQRLLIGLYSQSGQRGMALHQYESLVNLLQNDLGQAPEAETLSLYQSLISVEGSGSGETTPARTRPTHREPEPLLKTKLFIPPLRVDRVARPRLLELLDAGSQRSLTLISAPAGFGKTTLLASWAAHTGLPIAWFSIDEGDNDPARFIAYLIAALDNALSADLSEQFQVFMQSLQPSVQPTLVQLINYLAGECEPFVIILDDYQFIHSQDVHQALGFLIDKIPACMHLVIATRSDPPVSLARLRACDQLVEIRMSDLRFSFDESAGFLKQVMSLNLSPEDVSALEARTEGWIAGLQLAALAIRTVASRPIQDLNGMDAEQTVSRFIQAFSGSNRYILDYLGEEVLSRHPQKIRVFLLQTSILERFSGPLCDAVTETAGSQNVLEELEKENLFLIPLDSERHWYRYHHLFADLLRFKLIDILSKGSGHEREELPSLEELHLRAAGWLEKNQHNGEAVHHFIAAKKYDQAAELIEAQAYQMILTTGRTYTLREWLSELPEDLFRSKPRLNIAKAWTLILQNEFAAASEQLEPFWQAIQERQDAEADSILGEIALVQGVLAELRTRDVDAMRILGLLAWEKLSREDSMLRGLAAWLLGASYLFDGDTQHAESFFSQSIQLCQDAGNTFITSVAILDLSHVRMEQGRYHEAYHILQQSLQEMSSGARRAHPSLGYLYNGISQILLTWNELEEAERQLKLGIDLVTQDIPGEILIMSTSMLPYLKLAQGKREEALQLAEECLNRVEVYPLPYVPSIVKANLIRFWILVGDQNRIEEWLCNCGLTPDDPIRYLNEAEYTALAKVMIWQGRTEEALKVLAQLHELAKSQGRNGKLFYILALQALAMKQSNNLDHALKALETSLKLAQSEGYIRPYVEEGKPMEELLQFGAARGIWHQTFLDSYVNRLLKAIQLEHG